MTDLAELLPEDSWFKEWLSIWPLCEAPRTYLLAAGLSALGAVVGRGVYFSDDVHTLYPMLNLLLVGPSGIGKTTSLELGLGLVKSLPNSPEKPPVIIGKSTPERLHEDLVGAPHSVIYAEEFATFFGRADYMADMIPYVTSLLNYLDVVEWRTKKSGVSQVQQPATTLMGGSTPDWLQDQLPDSATTGGFLARFFIVFEEYKYRRIALPGLSMGRSFRRDLALRRDACISEFSHLSLATRGEMSFEDYGAIDTYTEWFGSFKPESGFLSPFAARAGEFVLRLAMLFGLGRFSLSISRRDVLAAVGFYSICAKKLARAVIPFSPDGKLLDTILRTVGNGEVGIVQLRRALRNQASARKVDSLVDSLLSSEELVWAGSGVLRRAI